MTIPTGGRSCYWCGEWIPYTINPLFWWCFDCHRYTGNSVPEEDRYIGHICRWKVIPGPKVVMYACTDSKCPKTFTSTLVEHQKGLKIAELAQYVHSQEFQGKVNLVIEQSQVKKQERDQALWARFEATYGKDKK